MSHYKITTNNIKNKHITICFLEVIGLFDKTLAQSDTTRNNFFCCFLILPIEFPIIETKEV